MMSAKRLAVSASVLALASLSAPAGAAIIIFTSPPGANTDENVLFDNRGPSNPLVTFTNKGTSVTFTGSETLEATAGGQAKISGLDGDLTGLNFFLTDLSQGMSAVEFSLSGLNGPDAPDDVTATIRFFDQFGAATTLSNFALGNGQSWFAAGTTMGSVISRVEIDTSDAILDVRHVRIAGADLAGAIPEPATWAMMIAGFGLAGGAIRRRRHRQAPAAAPIA